MKTKTGFLALLIVFLGCREHYVDPCREADQIITMVSLKAGYPENDEYTEMSVPKEDDSNAFDYLLRASPYNRAGFILPYEVEWRVADPTLVDISPLDPNRGRYAREVRAAVRTLADILDRGGEIEPETQVVACVRNNCESGDFEPTCVECHPEVCSSPIVIRAVINAEGSWRLEGATFPIPVEVYIKQTGHEVELILSNVYEARIQNDEVTFSINGSSGIVWRYTGQFINHEYVIGEVIQEDTGENLGIWTGTKITP